MKSAFASLIMVAVILSPTCLSRLTHASEVSIGTYNDEAKAAVACGGSQNVVKIGPMSWVCRAGSTVSPLHPISETGIGTFNLLEEARKACGGDANVRKIGPSQWTCSPGFGPSLLSLVSETGLGTFNDLEAAKKACGGAKRVKKIGPLQWICDPVAQSSDGLISPVADFNPAIQDKSVIKPERDWITSPASKSEVDAYSTLAL